MRWRPEPTPTPPSGADTALSPGGIVEQKNWLTVNPIITLYLRKEALIKDIEKVTFEQYLFKNCSTNNCLFLSGLREGFFYPFFEPLLGKDL